MVTAMTANYKNLMKELTWVITIIRKLEDLPHSTMHTHSKSKHMLLLAQRERERELQLPCVLYEHHPIFCVWNVHHDDHNLRHSFWQMPQLHLRTYPEPLAPLIKERTHESADQLVYCRELNLHKRQKKQT